MCSGVQMCIHNASHCIAIERILIESPDTMCFKQINLCYDFNRDHTRKLDDAHLHLLKLWLN